MSEQNEQQQNQQQNQQQDQQQTGHESQQQHADLGNELRELGNQLEQAFRNALNSETAKSFQRDFSRGLNEVSTQLQSALKTIHDKPGVQDLADRGQQAFHQVQESSLVKELQDAMTQGVAKLNEQLSSFITRAQSGASGENPPTQDIPIEEERDEQTATPSTEADMHAAAATGKTIQLDPDKQPSEEKPEANG